MYYIKQAKRKKESFCAFALLPVSHDTHLGHLLLAHGHMEEMFWYIYERCVVIFLKTITINIQLNLNVHCRFGRDLVKSSGYMIFILVYAESSKSIRMLAYRVSFCCCRSKVCSDAFVNLFSPSFLQHGCMLKS